MGTIITETTRAVLSPLESLWYSFVMILPQIVGALIVAIIGYFVGMILGLVVHKLLHKAGLDTALQKANIGKFLGNHSLSSIVGSLLKWFVFALFLSSAVNIISLQPLADVLQRLVYWLPQLIIGIIVMVTGLIGAEFIYERVSHAKKIKGIHTVAVGTKVITIIFAAIIALEQIGIRISIAREAFLIILASLGLGFAIAIGIGFGNVVKKDATSWLSAIKKL